MQVSTDKEILINTYNEYLSKLHLVEPLLQKDNSYKKEYYPIKFNSEKLLLNCMAKLNSFNILSSKDFQSSTSMQNKDDLMEIIKHSDDLNRILCLPLNANLQLDKLSFICAVIQYEMMIFQGE